MNLLHATHCVILRHEFLASETQLRSAQSVVLFGESSQWRKKHS